MSLYLAVELQPETQQQLYGKLLYLKRNCLCGDWEDPTRFHITVKFISDDDQRHEPVIDVLKHWEQKFQPKKFEVFAKDFCRFPQGVEWIGVNNSLPLYTAKKQIEDCAAELGNMFKKDDHDGYTPHITMGFNVEEGPNLVKEFEGIPVLVDNITLWGYAPKVNGVHIANTLYRVNLV